MENNIRQQLTLFVPRKDAIEIELIRNRYNHIQHNLIDSHVTLCREDEIVDIDQVLCNLKMIDLSSITINFGKPVRFENGNGVLLPAYGINEQFHELRKKVLTGLLNIVRHHEPHITLLHPRNSTFNKEVFKAIQKANLPANLNFDTISLIEQINGSKWRIKNEFKLKTTTPFIKSM